MVFFFHQPYPFAHQDSRFSHLALSPKSFCHRILQRYEVGPPPCQCSSVIGVIEVGALSMEAARSLLCKIIRCRINSIPVIYPFGIGIMI